MIPKETVDRIIDSAHVEDVVGEFVTLKKRGPNLLGLCPFHNEKTPSFTVSPVKGFYKCFGCGKAGGSVNFIMDHLKLTYPEALRWLAKKYGIEVVEKEFTAEEKEKQNERESLLIVMQYAQRFFTQQMLETDEGKSVGYGYFQERGLHPQIIEKFQLGYSPENRSAFTSAAIKAGYQARYLVKCGMSILRSGSEEEKEPSEKDLFDRFAGRVMFPVLDEGGRVVAFGGRILNSEKKTAKYINSPETEIYHKSRVLYGLWYAKKAIQQADSCYLVEGYMDVIAMHQAGVENVVASSGTSLTVEQIKAIHRYTRNIVVLFDGDLAGQKASMRAIPMLLEEGMNVRLLMFPDNNDPDSYSRSVGAEQFRQYLTENSKDFLLFKADRSKHDSANDPIKRAALVRELVEDISRIPDNITRSVYIKQCAAIMEMDEQILQNEVNKIRRTAAGKGKYRNQEPEAATELQAAEGLPEPVQDDQVPELDHEEKELLRIMILYGNVLITVDGEDEETAEEHAVDLAAADYIVLEMVRDEMRFENPIHNEVLEAYLHEYSNMRFPDQNYFLHSANPIVSQFTIQYVINSHELSSKWSTFGVSVPLEIELLNKGLQRLLNSYKDKKLRQYIRKRQEELKTADELQHWAIVAELRDLERIKTRINRELGRTVIR